MSSDKISVLMTVYNEAEFVEYAIRSCVPFVDHLVIVEGAYQETIKLGANPRSTDGTKQKIEETIQSIANHSSSTAFMNNIHYIEANAQSDKDQRNIGLNKIKELNPDGWCLIIDGDEVYQEDTFKMIEVAIKNMEKTNKTCACFQSITFVNDFKHFTMQEFPRLFKITPQCQFINDNNMDWPEIQKHPALLYVKIPYIKYHHYSFCKNAKRFELKKQWWEKRFDVAFDYGWHLNENGKIDDKNHHIIEYKGKHPEVIKSHPLYQE